MTTRKFDPVTALIWLANIALFIYLWPKGFPPEQPAPAATAPTETSMPISRDSLRSILHWSGGIGNDGYLLNAVSVTQAYGSDVPNGTYAHPMEWQPEHSILLTVQDGYVIRLDYHLTDH
jgi:hypothetical protein